MQAESLTLYFAEIRRTPLLTAADEVALGLRIRDGDADALTRMVQANLQFVVMIAKQYARFGLPIEDLIAEGNLMLYHAARKYDPTRGVRFASYRSRVLDRLLARLDEKSRLLVRARFGLDGLPPRQHKDISAEIGISANWAGQLEQRAMAKLRMLAQREGIRFEDVA
jgi:RNA polymerase primary sigma factor